MTPFAATLRAEWTKLATLRSTKPAIALALLVGVALSALLAFVIGEPTTTGPPGAARLRADRAVADRRPPERDLLSRARRQGGDRRAQLGHDPPLTATPRRGRVLAAKAAVVGAVTLLAASSASPPCSA
jgi:ABC-2 type transport system permease protein